MVWLSLEGVGGKLVILPEVDVSEDTLPDVVLPLTVEEKGVAVPTEMVSDTEEACLLVCVSPDVSVP